MGQVAEKAVHHGPGIKKRCRMPEVEQIPPFLPLVQGAQLGAEQLVDPVGRDDDGAGVPAGGQLERIPLVPEHREVFTGVDLHLQPDMAVSSQ